MAENFIVDESLVPQILSFLDHVTGYAYLDGRFFCLDKHLQEKIIHLLEVHGVIHDSDSGYGDYSSDYYSSSDGPAPEPKYLVEWSNILVNSSNNLEFDSNLSHIIKVYKSDGVQWIHLQDYTVHNGDHVTLELTGGTDDTYQMQARDLLDTNTLFYVVMRIDTNKKSWGALSWG